MDEISSLADLEKKVLSKRLEDLELNLINEDEATGVVFHTLHFRSDPPNVLYYTIGGRLGNCSISTPEYDPSDFDEAVHIYAVVRMRSLAQLFERTGVEKLLLAEQVFEVLDKDLEDDEEVICFGDFEGDL